MIRLMLCCIVSMHVCLQCTEISQQDAQDETGNTDTTAASRPMSASTRTMASILAQAYAEIDPEKTNYLVNAERVQIFNERRQQGSITERINAWSFYAYELLNAGSTEQAIVEIESLLTELSGFNLPPETILRVKRLLAMSYLRLAEEQNCVGTRNHLSCIVPIAPEGQYTMTRGSQTAMRICLEILNQFPKDEETMWILNLAAMTIGVYPEGIPEQWRIPETYIGTRTDFPRFTDISHRVGITGTGLAGGACMEDFDNDGWLDIITSSWGKDDPLTFWKSTGDGRFINASEAMGLQGITGGINMLHADINNDGLADILVLRGAWLLGEGTIPNSLLLNQGNGYFSDVTESAGVLNYAPTQNAVFTDFNLDGWIDVFIGNESSATSIFENELHLNRGDGTFMNIIGEIDIDTKGFIKGSAAGDINNDGWPDLFISNFTGPNMLLLNKGVDQRGIPKFENIARSAGVEEPQISFPCWIWDFDNDGWEDIFVSGYGDRSTAVARDYVLNSRGEILDGYPRVYRNNGDLTFTEVSRSMGLTDNIFTMGCNYGDLDADGYLDFYLGTGNPDYSSAVPNKMYRNNAGKNFEDITAAGGFGHIQKGHAVAFGDLDRDGDEDLFEAMGGAFEGDIYEDLLYENPIGQDRSWVVLQLQGVKSNRSAIGARVKIEVTTPEGKQSFWRTVSTGGSFGSSSLQLEVGLGDAVHIDRIEVTWPVIERTIQIFRDVPLNRYVRITEGNEEVAVLEITKADF